MLEKNENLNITDLDVQELENRLEMAMMEAGESSWVGGPPKPSCHDFPATGTVPCQPGVPNN